MLDQTVTDFVAQEISTDQNQFVLIVDDDDDHAEAIAHGLRNEGFRPLVSRTVSNAILMTQIYRPRVVILDVNLPDGNGLELCEMINDDSETCDIPVIILSANGEPDIVRRARHAGCKYYIHKPHDPKALLTLVNDSVQGNFSW